MTTQRPHDTTGAIAIVALALATACTTPVPQPAAAPDDPDAGFVAHETRAGVVIDRMAGGEPAVVVTKNPWPWGDAPTFVLREGGAVAAGLWLTSPATVIVRAGADPGAPPAGRVEPSWEDGGAIRLTLRPPGGPPLHTGAFARQDGGAGPSELTRLAQDSLDLQGIYEAPLLAADGARVGWLRVALARRSPRPVFEGVFPPAVDERLAAAAVEALDSEIGWIDNHVRGVTLAPEDR
jgi:hypothetical protein